MFSKYDNKGYTGLSNLGNTCFLNSCLQILNHTYELHELFDQDKTELHIKTKTVDSILLQEWNDLRKIIWSNNGTVAPNRFVNQLQKVSHAKNRELFTGWNQNDMPEFLLLMIECFHNSISRKINIKISGKKENSTDNMATVCYTMLKQTYSKEYSEIMDLFYGIYVSTLSVSENGPSSNNVPESYFMLYLSIPDHKSIVSLHDCFDLFTKVEFMTKEDSGYKNEKTGEAEDVYKQIKFWNFPNLLVINLKRFSADGKHKIKNMVEFPINDLDLSKYVVGYNSSKYIYDLYGVCNHIGGVNMGHYTAFVRNSKNEWIHFNDDSVEIVKDERSIITPMAYCLFYRKKNK